ncbi:MAG: hypothetical protein Q9179_004034 [Wetmoreana sp. 5 TL-2023]
MRDDDPKVVRDMFYFFYNGQYPVDNIPLNPIDTMVDVRINQKHIDMYNIAVKYGVETLQQYAAQAFRSHIPECTTLDFLHAIGPVYVTDQRGPLHETVIQEAGHRHRELMVPGSRTQQMFLLCLSQAPLFQMDLFMQFFGAGAAAMCRNCRGWIDQPLFCNNCEPHELVKVDDSIGSPEQSDDDDFGHVENSSQTMVPMG